MGLMVRSAQGGVLRALVAGGLPPSLQQLQGVSDGQSSVGAGVAAARGMQRPADALTEGGLVSAPASRYSAFPEPYAGLVRRAISEGGRPSM